MKTTVTVFAVLLLALAARSLTHSEKHLIPIHDEVAYLDLARDFAARGGTLSTIADYARGRVTEDKRHPLYLMLIASLMDNSPADFSRAKLASLAIGAAVVIVVGIAAGLLWGWTVGAIAAGFVALSPIVALQSQQLLADLLFAGLYFGAVMILIRERETKLKWTLFGAVTGLAYLCKGNGHLLFGAAIIYGAARYKAAFLKKPFLYLAIAAFAAACWFLLLRNILVWHSPFYNFNNKVIWLDSWNDYYFLHESGAWANVGPRWFFKNHTLTEILVRYISGLLATGRLFLMALSTGPMRLPWPYITGIFISFLVGVGLRSEWRSEKKAAVATVVGLSIFMFLLFAWNAAGTENQWRYLFPIAMTLFPYAAVGLAQLFSRKFFGRFANAGLMVAALVILFSNRSVVGKNPLTFWSVPDFWRETSSWIQTHAGPEGFALSNLSRYSTWDSGRDNRRPYPFEIPAANLEAFLARNKISTILIDQSVIDADPYKDKYGPSDEHGPKTFLGRPRRFADTNKPSSFLIFTSNN